MSDSTMDIEAGRMLPATAYTSADVLDWELRNLFAGSWTCLGRVDDLLPLNENGRPVIQRAIHVGDVSCLLVRHDDAVHMFANTCRHRGHELLPDQGTSQRRSIVCPYHAWAYGLDGALIGAKGFLQSGFPEVDGFDADSHSLVELPVRVWEGFVLGHALHRLHDPAVPEFEAHLGDLARIVAPYSPGSLVLAGRHEYEVAANWKVIAENYHECYHCPLIHPELCRLSPPDSGDNYDLPGSWIGGSMELREGMETMSLTGERASTSLPAASPGKVEYVHLLPNLLLSAHPDYVMVHRLVPLAPYRTWVECSWLVLPGSSGARGAVDFWDITNRQDWAACESVQRGLTSPHFAPGPFGPTEFAVAQLVGMIGRAYRDGGLATFRPAPPS
ncbi:MAG: aromatic ring-hydroxylating oxygenase subunit alpha [Jatrophihabitantaceae bacterium]